MSRRILHYSDNEKIITSGNKEKRMFIILEGTVAISLSNGNEKIPVAELTKGDFFGEISLFSDRPRSANAYAVGDVKVAYIDDEQQLKSFLIKNPNFAAKMVYILTERLAKTDKLLIGKVNELNRIKLIRDV